MSKITIEHLSYCYDAKINALDDVSFNIKKGAFCGIIGPNGSGKTTLLKCISGYLNPPKGRVLIDDKDVRSFSTREISKTMALVQQHFALEYDFTVLDIVLTGRNPHLKRMQSETKEDYAIANAAMRRAEVYHLKNRMVTELSGGEWQRMILARALAQQASIMLLDEPVTGLDIKHQVAFLRSAKTLSAQENISVVCVLHDLNLAQNYCDQIVLLKHGKLYKMGTPKQVLTKANLEHVYGTKVAVFDKDGTTYILPQYHG